MILKRSLNLKRLFVIFYTLAFLVYIIYGLHPVEATEAYDVDTVLTIPSIGLNANVTVLEQTDDGLITPDDIVGSYSKYLNKTLLIGHSTGVFKDLNSVKNGDEVKYNGISYRVNKLVYTVKESINMEDLVAPADKESLILMTCAGELMDDGDATHRLVIFASV